MDSCNEYDVDYEFKKQFLRFDIFHFFILNEILEEQTLEYSRTYSIFHFVSKFALKLVTVPGAALVEVFWYLGFLSLSFSFASSSRSSKSTEPSVWNLDSKFLTVPGTALVEDLFISLLLCFSVLSRSAWFVQFVTRIMLVNSNDIK